MPTCPSCSQAFSCEPSEVTLRAKFAAPMPRLCPSCRQQRRLAHINQLHLFKRQCAATQKPIVTNFPPECEVPVFSQAYWYSDGWSPLDYGVPYDQSRSFFAQFAELQRRVPRPALFTDYLRDENSAYTNYAAGNKNCYLIFQSGYSEDAYYSYFAESSKGVVDVLQAHNSELCYESRYILRCYRSAFLAHCETCRESYFLDNCIGCSRCICCVNLRHKDLHIGNKPVSEAEFVRTKELLSTHDGLLQLERRLNNLRKDEAGRALHTVRCEDSLGDNLIASRHARWCFDSQGLEDAAYCTQCFTPLHDALDCDGCGEGEIIYESNQSGMRGYNLRWTLQCVEQVRDLTYCDTCLQSNDLFGCVGLRRAKHCILNVRHSPDEYFKLRDAIVEDMKRTGEWGEFFPIEKTLVPYNLSMAATHFPLSKSEVTRRGLWWRDPTPSEIPAESATAIPHSIQATDDTFTKRVFSCATCAAPFRFIPQEVLFHRDLGIVLPVNCFHCRHHRRMALRGSRSLRRITCAQCGHDTMTGVREGEYRELRCEGCYERGQSG